MKILDITRPISELTPPYPGDPPTIIRRAADLATSCPATVSAISMSCHLGTHVDAPLHVIADGRGSDEIPLDLLVGEAEVVGLERSVAVTAHDLELARVPPGARRLLLKTKRRGRQAPVASAEQVGAFLGEDAARWLVDRGIKLVGIDTLSIDPLGSEVLVAHRVLLGADVVVLEGLELGAVSPGAYTLVCLPLSLVGCDGAPARAVLLAKTHPETEDAGETSSRKL